MSDIPHRLFVICFRAAQKATICFSFEICLIMNGYFYEDDDVTRHN